MISWRAEATAIPSSVTLSALDAPLVANAVIAYIKALGTVHTNADGRIVMK